MLKKCEKLIFHRLELIKLLKKKKINVKRMLKTLLKNQIWKIFQKIIYFLKNTIIYIEFEFNF